MFQYLSICTYCCTCSMIVSEIHMRLKLVYFFVKGIYLLQTTIVKENGEFILHVDALLVLFIILIDGYWIFNGAPFLLVAK